MANYYRRQNSILSFVAMAFLLYFVGLPLIIAILMEYFGSVDEIIINVVGLIPFGQQYYELAIQFINSLSGQVVSYVHMTNSFTIGYMMGELAKELFTVIIFEALNLGVGILLGFTYDGGKISPQGFWNRAKYILATAVNALIAACLSPIPLNYIFSNLSSLGNIGAGVISFLISAVLVSGGIAFFVFLSSLSIGMAIGYVFIKFFLMGACRISVSYLAILMILIGWKEGVFFLSAGGVTALLALGIMLGAIEMMLQSVFD